MDDFSKQGELSRVLKQDMIRSELRGSHARKNKLTLSERWREKIRVSMLINRLSNHAAGRIKMTATQVRAAEILLKRAIPELLRTEHTGLAGGPIEYQAIYYADSPTQLYSETVPVAGSEGVGSEEPTTH